MARGFPAQEIVPKITPSTENLWECFNTQHTCGKNTLTKNVVYYSQTDNRQAASVGVERSEIESVFYQNFTTVVLCISERPFSDKQGK